jgi:two-component system, OmpR family, response regulator
MKVLVVEDDPQLALWLRDTLGAAFGAADVVGSLEEGRAAVAVMPFDLVVLDRRLPDGDGLELLPTLRQQRPCPATLMVTAMDDATDIVRALDGGADDYIAKPFEPIELVARARAVLRRVSVDQGATVAICNLSFDVTNRMAYVDGRAITVPRRELAILEALIRRSGRVVPRGTLEAAVYGFDEEIQSNAIDAHVSRLRRRLRESNCAATIRPIRGLGYLLAGEE